MAESNTSLQRPSRGMSRVASQTAVFFALFLVSLRIAGLVLEFSVGWNTPFSKFVVSSAPQSFELHKLPHPENITRTIHSEESSVKGVPFCIYGDAQHLDEWLMMNPQYLVVNDTWNKYTCVRKDVSSRGRFWSFIQEKISQDCDNAVSVAFSQSEKRAEVVGFTEIAEEAIDALSFGVFHGKQVVNARRKIFRSWKEKDFKNKILCPDSLVDSCIFLRTSQCSGSSISNVTAHLNFEKVDMKVPLNWERLIFERYYLEI
mmetsp:Transcript_10009/g.13095  ORF Transcript_10009/g.13095 Transcript_10009/m.13095 type:complete len:260 (+) Transcript_10009:124-903(+)